MDRNSLNQIYIQSEENIKRANREIKLSLESYFNELLTRSASMGYGSVKYGLADRHCYDFIQEAITRRRNKNKPISDDATIRVIIAANFASAEEILKLISSIYKDLDPLVKKETVGLNEGSTIFLTWNTNGPTQRIENA